MSENIEKISSQMRKGILEYVILMIINSWEVYSSDILKILKENNFEDFYKINYWTINWTSLSLPELF